jgi:hypothetical protein
MGTFRSPENYVFDDKHENYKRPHFLSNVRMVVSCHMLLDPQDIYSHYKIWLVYILKYAIIIFNEPCSRDILIDAICMTCQSHGLMFIFLLSLSWAQNTESHAVISDANQTKTHSFPQKEWKIELPNCPIISQNNDTINKSCKSNKGTRIPTITFMSKSLYLRKKIKSKCLDTLNWYFKRIKYSIVFQ